MRRLTPSPAMIVAIIALITSVTSGAYAAVRITTNDIANGAVTQPKLASNSVWHANIGTHSVRTVNIATNAVTQRTLAPNSVWHANIGRGSVQSSNVSAQLLTAGGALTGTFPDPQLAHGSVGTAQIANGAVGSAQLAAPEAWHTVGEAGQPAFENGWTNAGLGANPTSAGFMIDQDGVVHLRGQVAGGTVSLSATGTVFTLPAGYRPTGGARYFPVLATDASNTPVPGGVVVNPSGQVIVGAVGTGGNHFVALDNISFRP